VSTGCAVVVVFGVAGFACLFGAGLLGWETGQHRPWFGLALLDLLLVVAATLMAGKSPYWIVYVLGITSIAGALWPHKVDKAQRKALPSGEHEAIR